MSLMEKKIIILNKEYISLEEKLNFIKSNNFDLVLCLNPNYKIYEKKIGIKFKFWPNAVDHMKFDKKNDYKYDFCFSGLIQNFNIDENLMMLIKYVKKYLKEFFINFMA